MVPVRATGVLVALTLGALAFSSPAAVAAPGASPRILVSLHAGERPAAVMAGARVRPAGRPIPQIGAFAVRAPAGTSTAAAVRRLRADRRVRAASVEQRFTPRYEPDDPALRLQEPQAPAGMPLQWALGRQGFPLAWDTVRGEEAIVAVLDTGVDATHPDLRGKVAAAMDFDDASGDPPTTDADGHGTHVASLACAATDDGIGIAGAGFGCRLLVIKTDFADLSVARGIVAAADAGVHALNMSFGDTGEHRSQILADALGYAVAHGVVLVAAAADRPVEDQGEPANLLQPPGTGPDLGAGIGLTVTAAQADDRRAAFAGRGGQISLAAYGVLRSDDLGGRGLFAAYPAAAAPRCECRGDLDGDTRYAFLPGTSMAAPQVAAAAALIRTLNPQLTVPEVVRLLKEHARRPAGADWDPELGWGILDAGAAVEAARRVDRIRPRSRAFATATVTGRSVLVRWRGSDPAPRRLIASGVARYEVFRATGSGRPRRVATTTATRRRFAVRPGARHRFFTVAVDRAGNRELRPARADVRVRVVR